MAKKRRSGTRTLSKEKCLETDCLVAREIVVADKRGGPSICLSARDGHVHVSLCDGKNRPRLTLSLDPGGEPHIQFNHSSGQQAIAMGVAEDGSAGLTISNPLHAREAIRLGIRSELDVSSRKRKMLPPSAAIEVTDKEGKRYWLHPAAPKA